MEVYREIAPLQHYLNAYKFRGKNIGLVPTMGALHEGHLTLLRAAQQENDLTICSIYVNPTQFNNLEDLEKYPRVIEKDLSMLQEAGCDVVFCPSDAVMYQQPPKVSFDFKGLDTVLEGRYRPGHFSGVGLIVSKLFNIVGPDQAYFGQKDLQQYLIIKQLIADLSFNVKAKCIPVVREADGLAMSSRNKRLSHKGRAKAPVLFKVLGEARNLLQAKETIELVKQEVAKRMEQADVQLEYFEIVDPDSLEVLENKFSKKNVALCVAGYVDDIRLIDNIIFKLDF